MRGCGSEGKKTNAEREEIRMGDFAPPGSVPHYETVEDEPVERDCVMAIRLLVDTPARSEPDYTLISPAPSSRSTRNSTPYRSQRLSLAAFAPRLPTC
jgi:hypothetical protein